MRIRKVLLSIVTVAALCLTVPANADILFQDTYDRANALDIDADSTGMSGTISPATYIEAFEKSGTGSIQIVNNRLQMATGTGMSNGFIDTNFIGSGMLVDGAFTVSIDVVAITSVATDEANRFGGFGVGMTRDEAVAAGDIGDNVTTYRGGASAAGVCDLFVDLAIDGIVRIWRNGVVVDSVSVNSPTGTIKAEFTCDDFNAGSPVAVNVYFNNSKISTLSFSWEHDNSNYIGLSARASSSTTLDNLIIETTEPQLAGIVLMESDGSTMAREGGFTDTISYKMTADPGTYPVTIQIEDVLNPDQISLSASEIIFTTDNWQAMQTVTITAIDDNDMERALHDTVISSTVMADPASDYSGMMIPDLFVQVEDNDCGAWGFNPADFNLDCQVDMNDFARFVQEWIACSHPDPTCQDYRL